MLRKLLSKSGRRLLRVRQWQLSFSQFYCTHACTHVSGALADLISLASHIIMLTWSLFLIILIKYQFWSSYYIDKSASHLTIFFSSLNFFMRSLKICIFFFLHCDYVNFSLLFCPSKHWFVQISNLHEHMLCFLNICIHTYIHYCISNRFEMFNDFDF